jgi:hypothetical protein
LETWHQTLEEPVEVFMVVFMHKASARRVVVLLVGFHGDTTPT